MWVSGLVWEPRHYNKVAYSIISNRLRVDTGRNENVCMDQTNNNLHGQSVYVWTGRVGGGGGVMESVLFIMSISCMPLFSNCGFLHFFFFLFFFCHTVLRGVLEWRNIQVDSR